MPRLGGKQRPMVERFERQHLLPIGKRRLDLDEGCSSERGHHQLIWIVVGDTRKSAHIQERSGRDRHSHEAL